MVIFRDKIYQELGRRKFFLLFSPHFGVRMRARLRSCTHLLPVNARRVLLRHERWVGGERILHVSVNRLVVHGAELPVGGDGDPLPLGLDGTAGAEAGEVDRGIGGVKEVPLAVEVLDGWGVGKLLTTRKRERMLLGGLVFVRVRNSNTIAVEADGSTALPPRPHLDGTRRLASVR